MSEQRLPTSWPCGNCVFCNPDFTRIAFYDGLVYAIWDAFPVSPGHALIIPRRHVASWFDATPEEQSDLLRAAHRMREEIEFHHQPDGYNLGINVGQAAGQTVFHLHLHIIPRYHGDVQDPTGGVRSVIPDHANYLAIHSNAAVGPQRLTGKSWLVTGDTDPLLPHLIAALDRATRIDMAVAFIQPSGLQLLLEHLRDLLLRGGSTRVLTGDYLDATDPDALVKLLDLHSEFPHQVQLRIFEATKQSFHPKAYLISLQNDETTAFIGSSNLTRRALLNGIEWNYRVHSVQDPDGIQAATHAFEDLFQHPATKLLTDEWIASYRARRATMLLPTRIDANLVEREAPSPLPTPHSIQQEALDALRAARADGSRAGMVVLATGLGKTWLSAFDSQAAGAERILFVAHHQGDLTETQQTAFSNYRDLLTEIEGTAMTKSLKMLTLLAMLQEGVFPGSISIDRLAHRFRHLSQLSRAIRRDFPAEVLETDQELQRWIERNPIDAWVGRTDKSGRQLFEYKNGIFRTVFPWTETTSSELGDLVRELVDWRIADYESRDTNNESSRIFLRVLQSNGRPILKLDRKRYPETPSGWTTVIVDDVPHNVNFVKEFVNVARLSDTGDNVLPAIMQRWFGPQAGQPGTRFEVELMRTHESWTLTKRM